MQQSAPEARSPLLAGLRPAQVDQLLALAETRSFVDGAAIISEHESGGALFLVASGEVRVEKTTLGRDQTTITFLGPGECFGELSLVDREPRSATVRASGEAKVHVWRREDLLGFLEADFDAHRKVLENLVRITAQRLRRLDETLVESAYDNVVEVDGSFRVTRWERLHDRCELLPAAGSAVGKDLFELAPALGEAVRHRARQVMESGEPEMFPLDLEGPDGGRRYFELTLAAARGKGGTGVILGIRDVTDQRVLESRLIRAEKLAMAGRMSAEIGHELRNFLTGASGLAELLRSDRELAGLPRASANVELLSTQIEKMQRFAIGLLDLGMVRSRVRTSDLNSLVERLVGFVEGQSRFRTVEFVQRLDRSLPSLEVDPGQIQQVLLNLYVNAAEALGGERRGRVVTTTRMSRDEATAELIVEDDGPGMPQAVRQRVFEHSFTTKDSGHGFGLAISRRIVENHGGTIQVESEPGAGTRFELRLPLAPPGGR